MKQMYIGTRGRAVFVGFAREDDRFRLITPAQARRYARRLAAAAAMAEAPRCVTPEPAEEPEGGTTG